MNFKEMEYILAVEQEKNLTKAARKIGISQPAMSKCLRNIETELGVSLFEKISGEYIPTAAGKLFLSFAQETKEREAQFLRELQELVQFQTWNDSGWYYSGKKQWTYPRSIAGVQKELS